MTENGTLSEWEVEKREHGMMLIHEWADAGNSMSGGKAFVNGMLDAFDETHRTLQQSIVRDMAAFLHEWQKRVSAQPGGYVDARNQAAAEWAKRVVPEPVYFPLI